VDLSQACGQLPHSLVINGLEVVDDRPYRSGGFADIYRGVYKGKDVALKRLRAYQNARGLADQFPVSHLSLRVVQNS
jgi:hypothetical protein